MKIPFLLSLLLISTASQAEPAGNGTHYDAPIPEIHVAGLCSSNALDSHYIKISAYGEGRWRLDYCSREKIGDCTQIGRRETYSPAEIAAALSLATNAKHEYLHEATFIIAKLSAFGVGIYAVVAKNPLPLVPALGLYVLAESSAEHFTQKSYEEFSVAVVMRWLSENSPAQCLTLEPDTAFMRDALNRALDLYELK